MKAQAIVSVIVAQGNLGANIITGIETGPRAASVDAGERSRR